MLLKPFFLNKIDRYGLSITRHWEWIEAILDLLTLGMMKYWNVLFCVGLSTAVKINE